MEKGRKEIRLFAAYYEEFDTKTVKTLVKTQEVTSRFFTELCMKMCNVPYNKILDKDYKIMIDILIKDQLHVHEITKPIFKNGLPNEEYFRQVFGLKELLDNLFLDYKVSTRYSLDKADVYDTTLKIGVRLSIPDINLNEIV